MSRVICVASGKGGAGKTTGVANIGIALSELGEKVLVIDADIAMANLSLILGMQSSPITLHEVLLDEATVSDAIYEGPKGISIMPSGLSIESYQKADSSRLKEVINDLKDEYSFILIDAPAGIEKNVISAMVAAEQTIIVLTPDTPSLADALKTKMIAQKSGAKPIGVIINFVGMEKGEITTDKIVKLLELPSYGSVPFDIEVRKTFIDGKNKPIILRNPNNRASKAFKEIALRITGKATEEKKEKKSFFASIFEIFKRR